MTGLSKSVRFGLTVLVGGMLFACFMPQVMGVEADVSPGMPGTFMAQENPEAAPADAIKQDKDEQANPWRPRIMEGTGLPPYVKPAGGGAPTINWDCHLPQTLPTAEIWRVGEDGEDEVKPMAASKEESGFDLVAFQNCPEGGTYNVVYVVQDPDNSDSVIRITLRVVVKNLSPPEILQCALDRTLEVEKNPVTNRYTFTMPDFTRNVYAWDACMDSCPISRTNVMKDLAISQSCEPGTEIALETLPAEQVVTISVADNDGLTSECQLILTIVDKDAPVITLRGMEDDDTDPPYNDSVGPGGRTIYYPDTCEVPGVPAGCALWSCGIQRHYVTWECSVPFDPWCGTALDPATSDPNEADITDRIKTAYRRLKAGGAGWDDGEDVVIVDTSAKDVVYIMRYEVTNDLGITTIVERWITIVDTTKPVISLRAFNGRSGEATTGGNPAIYDDKHEDATDQNWLNSFRDGSAGYPEWITRIIVENFSPALPPSPVFVDAEAMQWNCWHLDFKDPGMDVHDACEGQYSQDYILDNTLAVVVKVFKDKKKELGYQYDSGVFETFVVAEMLRYLDQDLPRLDPSFENDNLIFYGYRIYYFTPDTSGNTVHIARHVKAVYGSAISLAPPTVFEMKCDDDISALGLLENRDRAADICLGDVTHLIVTSGDLPKNEYGYYIPGTYYREYYIKGSPVTPTSSVRRKIIVRDTPPEIHLFGAEEPHEELPQNIVLNVSWCEFLDDEFNDPGDPYRPDFSPAEKKAWYSRQALRWANKWWPIQKDPDPEDMNIEGGYNVTHICDDDRVLTDWMHVYGDAVLRSALATYGNPDTRQEDILNEYNLVFSLQDPRYNLFQRNVTVLLTEDIQFDLEFGPDVAVTYGPDGRTIVTFECMKGSSMATPLPTVTRQWDACTGKAIQREVRVEVDQVLEDGSLEPFDLANITAASPGVYLLYYKAVIAPGVPLSLVRTVELHIVDTTAPVISLEGEPVMELGCEQLFADPGASAFDLCDGDLSSSIYIRDDNTSVLGTKIRRYTVTDRNGNKVSIDRTIREAGLSITLNDVLDDTANSPVYGRVNITEWPCNTPWREPGVLSVSDECTGVSYNKDKVVRTPLAGNPGVDKEAYIKYSYTDTNSGKTIETVRQIVLVDDDGPEITLEGVGDPPVTGETPVEPLAESDSVPEWWQAALAVYGIKYPEGRGYASLPKAWRIAELTPEAWANAAPLPWECNLPVYDEPGVLAEDNCNDVNMDAIVLILTQYNAAEGREYFRYAGPFGDFEANPPGHAYDDSGQATNARNLREDVTGLLWPCYRAYYMAWDDAGNYSVKSRLIAPSYPKHSVECGDPWLLTTGEAVQACVDAYNQVYNTTYQLPQNPYFWLWRFADAAEKKLEVDGSGLPVDYAGEEKTLSRGDYVAVYEVVNSAGDTLPPKDISGTPLNAPGLAENGDFYLQYLRIEDTLAPEIVLKGAVDPVVPYYSGVYVDEGFASALDGCDGDLADAVEVEGSIDTAKLGKQTLTYKVKDAAGNIGTAKRTVNVKDLSDPEIVLTQADILLECGTVYKDSGVSARDAQDGADLTGRIRVEGLVPALVNPKGARTGTYVITYAVSRYDNGNSDEKKRTVTVIDTTPPALLLKGDLQVTLACGSAYQDAGVLSAVDKCDGDLSGQVEVSGEVNTLKPGTHTLVYSVMDGEGNTSQVVRSVTVVDESQPEIIVAPPAITLECGAVYADTGVTARDNADGTDLTPLIRKTGLAPSLVDAAGARPGVYTIGYQVEPVEGCKMATASRTVTVKDTQAPVVTLKGDVQISVDCGSVYRDAGVASAVDACDGDMLNRVTQSGNVDTNTPGLQEITFSVKDQEGNVGAAVRKVTVKNNCNKEEGETGGTDEGEVDGEPVGQTQVPDVAQQYLEDAQAVVLGANLVVGEITYEYDSQVPEGYILRQHPAAGEVVDQATPVDLVVSKGARSCGCDTPGSFVSGDMFLGLLGLIVLVVVTLCAQGGALR